MAYTSTDLTNIQAAIIALAKGERVVRITLDNGETLQYGQADLKDLISLSSMVSRDVNQYPKYRHIIVDRGL